jgi:hypothetical protein
MQCHQSDQSCYSEPAQALIHVTPPCNSPERYTLYLIFHYMTRPDIIEWHCLLFFRVYMPHLMFTRSLHGWID